VEKLSQRQAQAVRLAADGLTNGEIAAELGIGPESVKTHLAAAYRKLGVRNRMEAANKLRG
jgi:DNA-binding CsgD family transcriptional regulator